MKDLLDNMNKETIVIDTHRVPARMGRSPMNMFPPSIGNERLHIDDLRHIFQRNAPFGEEGADAFNRFDNHLSRLEAEIALRMNRMEANNVEDINWMSQMHQESRGLFGSSGARRAEVGRLEDLVAGREDRRNRRNFMMGGEPGADRNE